MNILPADITKKIVRILALVFFALLVGSYFLPDRIIDSVAKSNYYEQASKIHAILRWGTEFSAIVLVMTAFFNHLVLKNLTVFAVIPLSLLEMIFARNLVSFYDAKWCIVYFAVTVAVQFITAVLVMTDMIIKKEFRFNNPYDYLNFIFVGLGFVFISMPIFFPQIFFGYTLLFVKIFNFWHWLYIGVIFAEIAVLYYAFRFKNHNTRWAVVVALSMGLFISYNSLFLKSFNLNRLPIQLCNLASYLVMILCVFRWKYLFNFMFLINITGALIAIIFLDMDKDYGVGYFWNVHFLAEHAQAFVIPTLIMGFRLFPRMDKKSLLTAFIGYNIYFAFCFTVGGLVNVFTSANSDFVPLNYFYMFDLQKAIEYFPILGFLRRSPNFTIRYFTVNLGLLLFVYIGFFTAVLLFYWAVQEIYKTTDDAFELRRSRIDMWERLTGKKSKLLREYPIDSTKPQKEYR
jgi:uncharacterized membrane protein YwaF